MMDKEEKRIDELVGSLMKESGMASPPSHDYTQVVMRNVMLLQIKKQKTEHIKQLIIFGLLALGLVVSLGAAIFFLWRSGQLSFITNFLEGLFAPVAQLLPFHIPAGIMGGILLHLMLIRLIAAIYLFKKRQKRLNWSFVK